VSRPLAVAPEQHQQQRECDLQWYLVGHKVTGDLNVPAGRVSFVVDGGSRSTEHRGEVFSLPEGYDTDVGLHRPGTCRLVEQVRRGCGGWG
jgi:hypothetical protein